MISKSFLKSSIIYTIGGALPVVAGLVLLPFYTNYLNDLQYTQVTFYISVSLLLQILFSYSIESYFGIKYTQLSGSSSEQRKFVGTVSVLLLLIGLGLLVVCAASGEFLFARVFNSDFRMEFWPYGFYSVLTAFFNSYFKAATNCLIYFKRPALFLTANLTNFIFTLAISIGGLYIYPDSIIGPIYGRLFSGVIIFIIGHYIFHSNGEFKLKKNFLKDLSLFCTPYVIYVLSGWCLNFFDRYVLQPFIPNTDLNTYDLIQKCFFGILFLQNSLTAVIYPKLYEIWNKQSELKTTKESNRYFNVFTGINIMALILFCIFIPLIYKLLIHNEKFYESEKYIGILCAGYGLSSILFFYLPTILYTKSIRVLLKIFGISALFQIGISYFTILQWGLLGAIYAGLLVKVIQIILSALLTKNIFIYEFNSVKIFGLPILYALVNIILFYLYPEYSVWNYCLQFIGFTLLFYVIFKNEISAVYKQFFGKKAEN